MRHRGPSSLGKLYRSLRTLLHRAGSLKVRARKRTVRTKLNALKTPRAHSSGVKRPLPSVSRSRKHSFCAACAASIRHLKQLLCTQVKVLGSLS